MPSTGSSSSILRADAAPASAQVVIGLTSYNNAETIGAVVRAVLDGMVDRGAPGPARLVLADSGSTDQTVDRARQVIDGEQDVHVLDMPPASIDPLRMPYHGLPGRAQAIHAVLRHAVQAEAAACVILDAGVTSLASGWVSRLSEPVVSGKSDYVSAYFARRAVEGAITKSIVYPVFRALYGTRLRQPAAAEFGCSRALMAHYLDQMVWTGEEAQAGIDLWLASAAATGGYRVCEAALGVRTQAPRLGSPNLSTTLAQIVNALFVDLEGRADSWQRVRVSAQVPLVGESPVAVESGEALDAEEFIEAFRLGYRALRDVWAWILPPKTILQLKRLADAQAAEFRIPDDTWARIMYDFALGHRVRAMARDHLLGSLTPLYLGWLGSFVMEVRASSPASVESRLEQLCVAFETEKPYLISRWRWPERFRS